MAERRLQLRWASTCGTCAVELPARSEAWWDKEAKAATCVDCHGTSATADEAAAPVTTPHPSPPVGAAVSAASVPSPATIDAGTAGASAQRSYEKKAARHQRENERRLAADRAWREELIERRPVLGRVASALVTKEQAKPVPQSTRAWAEGAAGERRVAEALAKAEGVIALHDRKVPGSKANIDHLAVAPSGVWVIDAKNYSGKLETRDVGGLFRTDQRLYIAGRDRTKLVTAMEWQVDCVRKALDDPDVPVHGVLCSVSTEWSLLAFRPPVVRGVYVAWPKALVKLVSRDGPLTAEQVGELAGRLATALPAA